MNRIEFLREQIIESRNFVNRLVSELPEDLWFVIPENTDSNFAWQIGHLIVAQNFHAITVITGWNEKVNRVIPVAQYNKLFNGMGTLHRSVKEEVVTAFVLKNQLDAVHEICIENLLALSDGILYTPLEPIPFKHEMWHSAEMEEIKRRLGYPIIWLNK